MKLPRFSTLIKIDLVQNDEILKNKLRLNIRDNEDLDYPSRDIKDLVDVVNLSPDYDIISRQDAREQLTFVLESKKSCDIFIEFNGVNVLHHLIDKCLDETSNYTSLLFPLIKCIKVILVHNIDGFEQEKLLYGLTRSLFLFSDNFDALDEGITTSYSAIRSILSVKLGMLLTMFA